MIETKRLLLRQWQPSDFELFAQMNQCPLVRKYFANLLTKEESDHSITLFQKEIETNGWGLWAVSLKEGKNFIGFIGIHEITTLSHLNSQIEIGWRLASNFWGCGYATEGAMAARDFGFKELNLKEMIAYTAKNNQPSRRVMEKLGMLHHASDDFKHPAIAVDNPLGSQVVYRLKQTDWKKNI